MSSLIVLDQSGNERFVEAQTGQTVMKIIRDAGLDDLIGLCGGNCACGTCHVHVDPAFADRVGPLGEDENDVLARSDHRDGRSRLSCQIRFSENLAGLRVTIAEED